MHEEPIAEPLKTVNFAGLEKNGPLPCATTHVGMG
jgi:hypothetical protein